MESEKKYFVEEALQRLTLGNEREAAVAFKQLYENHFDRLYSIVSRFLPSEEAKDIMQEVFSTIWVKRKSLGQVKNFEAYIYTCAKNQFTTYVKKKAKLELAKAELIAFELIDSSDTATEERLENLTKLIQKLPPQAQKVFTLAKLEGLSYQKIAERLDLSEITINHHMSAALRFLKERKHELGLFLLGFLLTS